jgi:ATP-dependent RNA helicase DeaD
VLEFAKVQITATVERALQEDEITQPTAIQEAAIGEILAGQHVVLESGTGTGKTLAYLLPILQRLAAEPLGRAVILTPSAELAIQILGIARRYKEEHVSVAGVVAGGNRNKVKDQLQKSTRLVVGTPARIFELYNERKLKGVSTMVLDELDAILVGDNDRTLRDILSRPDPKVQVIVVGATMGPKAEALVAQALRGPVVRVRVEDSPLHARIAHHFVRAGQVKEIDLVRFLENQRCSRAIVFVNQPQRIRHLYRFLQEHQHKPVTVSDERPKQERRAAIQAFDAGDAHVLITTDAAARGLDIRQVDWVLHYELPSSAQAYVHRAGRTGRAGRKGTSVAFVMDNELPTLLRFAGELDIECPPFPRR